MIYQLSQYFKFLIRSTNQHGVHSPFVYKLVTKCFYDKASFSDYRKLKNYKKSLLKNKSKIVISDLGFGSRITKNNTRKVSQIAFHSGTKFKRAKLLYRLTNYFKPNSVLELGTSLGVGRQGINLGNHEHKIKSFEGCVNF